MDTPQNASIPNETLSLNTTNNPSHVVQHSCLDIVELNQMLQQPVVLTQGNLPKDAQRGQTLFVWDVCPAALTSQTQKTILSHLSECFTQWAGTITFSFVITIPIYAQTKIVLAFVPEPYNPDTLDPASLVGFQNSIIINPANSREVSLPIPFFSSQNFHASRQRTGRVCAKLLDPLVTTMELNTGIPWTLMVHANPSSFRFRYLVPPLLPLTPTSTTDQPTMNDHVTAVSNSTRRARAGVSRQFSNFPLVRQPAPALGLTYETMMLIPRTRVEYVMQKVRGQFPSNVDGQNISGCIAAMFDTPAFTQRDVEPVDLPQASSMFPYIYTGFTYFITNVNNVHSGACINYLSLIHI